MYLLGYDIGSSSVKTALVDAETQEVIDVVKYPEQEMEIISRQKGWAEQQPELWWRYLCLGTQRILEKNNIDPSSVESIGISYQMHGLVTVDEELQVLRPAIIWCDSRAVSIGNRAFEKMGSEYCLENYQNSPGNFTASKLKWIKDNEPDIYKKIYKVMLPGDYIAMKLSGKVSTTISGLSEGILWNFKENRLATKLLDHYEIQHDLIPEILPTFSESGKLNAEASKQTGLAEGTVVSYRAGDQPNNALCLNVLRPGEIAATSGTSGVVYGVVDKRVVDEKSRVNAFAHVNYTEETKRTGVLLCINGAGIQYSWLRNQVARSNRSYDDMERMLSTVPVGSEGILIYPFGNGAERIFNNRNLQSHILNVAFNRHTRAHLYRAALEGVAFAFVYGINILKEMGIEVSKMRVGNDNMFRSEVFSTTIATLLNIDLEVYDTTGAVGAALASGQGSGRYQTVETVLSKIKPIKKFSPANNHTEYTQAYRRWEDKLDMIINNNTSNEEYESEEIAKKNKLISKQALLIEEQERKLNEVIKNLEGLKKGQLKSTYPDLSFEELKMCNFLKLRFTTKEIAEKLSLSYRGAETKRYRLRKKMNIDKGISLFAFLDSVPSSR